MKTDKEYPATHSMSTAWYIVDDEGNVGIMDYNDNGPVPWGVEETSCDDLKYGHWEDWENHELLRFRLTDEQVLDLLCNPHPPCREDAWFDCVVRVDKGKMARFRELCANPDIDQKAVLCLSENIGLYDIDFFDRCTYDTKEGKTLAKGSLRQMIDEGVIVEVFKLQCLEMDDQWQDGKVVHSKSFDNCPYYVFHQPYWNNHLPEKMHQPRHPVRIDQVPEAFRGRIHRVPGRFRDMTTFQIAALYPCDAYLGNTPVYVADGCSYQKFPLPDGGTAYTQCGGFSDSSGCSMTGTPTVLVLFDPREDFGYELKVKTDPVRQQACALPCLPNSIERMVADIRPRVILATDKALEVLSQHYPMADNAVTIASRQYPFYPYSALEENRSEIERLARLPYRGKHHPPVISPQEMERLVRQGVAKPFGG